MRAFSCSKCLSGTREALCRAIPAILTSSFLLLVQKKRSKEKDTLSRGNFNALH